MKPIIPLKIKEPHFEAFDPKLLIDAIEKSGMPFSEGKNTPKGGIDYFGIKIVANKSVPRDKAILVHNGKIEKVFNLNK